MFKQIKQFLNQVISESKQITWLSKSDTITSSMIVFVVVIISSVFFLLVDFGVYKVVNFLLNLGT